MKIPLLHLGELARVGFRCIKFGIKSMLAVVDFEPGASTVLGT